MHPFFFFFNHSCTFLLVFLFFSFSFDSRIVRAFEFVRRLIILLLPLPPSLPSRKRESLSSLPILCRSVFAIYRDNTRDRYLQGTERSRIHIRSSIVARMNEWTFEREKFREKDFSFHAFLRYSFVFDSIATGRWRKKRGRTMLAISSFSFFFSLSVNETPDLAKEIKNFQNSFIVFGGRGREGGGRDRRRNKRNSPIPRLDRLPPTENRDTIFR